MVGAAILMVSGALLLGTTISAYAAASMTGTPLTGLSNGSKVTLTGSGFADSSIGNILECNSDAKQPTVMDGGLVNASISVSCTAPSLSALVTTSAKGAVSTVFAVKQGTVGPPCGPSPAVVTCPAKDSAGKAPAADAALYPCPPTAAQQAIGDVCTLTYGDQANDSASVNILFGSETLGGSTTTTAAGATTTAAGATTTTGATTSTTGATTSTTGATTTTTTGAGTTTTTGATTTTTGATTTTTGATTTTTGATTTTLAPTTTTTATGETTTTTGATTTTTGAGTTTALTGAYELFCPGTPVGDVVLNDATTSATLSPSAPTVGQSFSVTGYQTMVNLPASLATAAAAVSPTLAGSATAQIDASGATPATTPEGPLSFSVPFPSPIPTDGVPLTLPTTAATVSGFTATSTGITIQEDSAATLSLTVAGSALSLTCTAYPNDAVTPSGITTSTPTAAPIAPVIAVAGGGSSTTTTAAPATTTTKGPSTSPTSGGGGGSTTPTVSSNQLAFTGSGPGIGILTVIGGALILLGFALMVVVDAPRRAMAQFATLGPTTWRKWRAGEFDAATLRSQAAAKGRQIGNTAVRVGSWLLGR
jgi:hypothetical protein